MAVDTANVCQDTEPSIDSDPFFTSRQIYSMNKNWMSKNTLKQKASLKWVLWILFQQHHQKV